MKPKKNKKYQLPTTKMFTPKFNDGGINDPDKDNGYRSSGVNTINADAYHNYQNAIPQAQSNTSKVITDGSGNRIRINADGTRQVYDSTGTKLLANLPKFDMGGVNNLYNDPNNPNRQNLNQQYQNNFQQSDFNSGNNGQGEYQAGMQAVGKVGAIGQVISSVAGIGDSIGHPIREQAEKVNTQTGQYQNINKAEGMAAIGGFVNPYEALTSVQNDPNASTGDKIVEAATGGAGTAFIAKDLYKRKQAANIEKVAEDPNRQAAMESNAANGISNSYMKLPTARRGGQTDINNTEKLYKNANTSYQNSEPNLREDMDYKFQQPNAEVEKQENAITPDGTFKQFDGNSHENGGIKTNLPQNTIIFSDKLKPQGSKETFAKLNMVNDTKKEDKIINDKFATKESKATAQLMDSIKNKNSQALFQEQEAQKQAEEQKGQEAFANGLYKFGGVVGYKNGGIHIKPSQVGSFTRFAKKHGMGVQEAASHVLAHKKSFNSSIQKKAQFAKNAASFKHENGGVQPVITPNPNGHNRRVSFSYEEGGIQDANYNYPRAYSNIYKDTHQEQKGGEGIWANGGMMKYDEGGLEGEDDPGLGLNFNAQDVGNATSANMSNQGQPFDWKSALYQGAGTLVQSAGQLAYLQEQGKKYDTQKMYNYKPTLLDPSSALRDADIQSNQGAYNLKEGSGGNAGNYLSNRIALAGQNTLNKASIRNQYDNENAQISNRGQEFNIGNQYRTDDINAMNKSAAQSAYYNSINQLGRNTASGMRDYKTDQIQQQQMNMLPYMYNNPEFQSYWDQYKKGR